jgi:hypothetical protein
MLATLQCHEKLDPITWLTDYVNNKAFGISYKRWKTRLQKQRGIFGLVDGNIFFYVYASLFQLVCVCVFVQDNLGGKINILGDDKTDHCVQFVLTNMCVILNSHRDRAV